MSPRAGATESTAKVDAVLAGGAEVARAAPTAGSSGLPDDVQPRLAAVVDVRSRWWFNRLNDALDELAGRGVRPSIVFLDATDEALVRRFESVRRPHPCRHGF